MRRPSLLISAGEELFASFFSRQEQQRLNRLFRWERVRTIYTTILQQAASPKAGVVWDPANSFAAAREQPADGATRLRIAIRHVHIKDLRCDRDTWKYVQLGEGDFPLHELKAVLQDLQYAPFFRVGEEVAPRNCRR